MNFYVSNAFGENRRCRTWRVLDVSFHSPFFGCFPLSIFLFQKVGQKNEPGPQLIFRKMMWASLIVILIVFSLVKTKIIHYSSFAYFPLVYLAALQIEQIISGKSQWNRISRNLFLLSVLIWTMVLIAIPILFININWLKELFSADPFALANLNARVAWSYWLIFQVLLYVLVICSLDFISTFNK